MDNSILAAMSEINITKSIWCTVFLCIFSITDMHANDNYLSRVLKGSQGETLPYRILYPVNFDPQQKYPVILFLHGAGERGSDNQKQLTHGASLFTRPPIPETFPAIVIFPQCPSESWWIDTRLLNALQSGNYTAQNTPYEISPSLQLVAELIKQKRAKPFTDTNRFYLMGLSMGAFGSFDLLYRYPDWFAAAVPICGGGDVSKVPQYAHKVAFWLFHGEEDSVVPVEHSRNMVNALREMDANVRYTEYPGVNHNSWDYAFEEDQLLKWVFEQSR